jgi:anti-sigma regulatory factor (Ser/Thr protein kinase)
MAPLTSPPQEASFCHEMLLYGDDAEFLAQNVPFITEALAADEPIMVAVPKARLTLLRGALRGGTERVRFADMEEIGRNPACIIPLWQQFLSEHGSGRRLRGIGEPDWAGRSAAQLEEWRRHESLLNLAFDQSGPFRLLCPYDVVLLDPAVVAEAFHTHPHVVESGSRHTSPGYVDVRRPGSFLEGRLPRAPVDACTLDIEPGSLAKLRTFVAEHAQNAGLPPDRTDDLVFAVNEVVTNTVIHGGGRGALSVWQEEGSIVCEVRDEGHIDQPLVGRMRPSPGQEGGRGLWMVNHLCDLMQLRSADDGNVVRLLVNQVAPASLF